MTVSKVSIPVINLRNDSLEIIENNIYMFLSQLTEGMKCKIMKMFKFSHIPQYDSTDLICL